MLTNWGTGRGSIITLNSVHNQQVERMCWDVKRIVVSQYRNLFYYPKLHQLLDPCNEVDLLCLHHVYILCINWASLPDSTITTHFALSMDIPHYSYSFSNSLVDSNDEPEECWSTYVIDEDGPVHNPDEDVVLQSHLDLMKDNCRPLIPGCNLWLMMIIMESHCTWKLILSFQHPLHDELQRVFPNVYRPSISTSVMVPPQPKVSSRPQVPQSLQQVCTEWLSQWCQTSTCLILVEMDHILVNSIN